MHYLIVIAEWMIAALVCIDGLAAVGKEAQRVDADTPAVGGWRAAGSMHERREYAGGVRLKDGRVLAVSGHPLEGKSIATAEIYDPASDTWARTDSLRQVVQQRKRRNALARRSGAVRRR